MFAKEYYTSYVWAYCAAEVENSFHFVITNNDDRNPVALKVKDHLQAFRDIYF